jgi:uncharacterized protein (TIGR03435 family)
MRVMMRALLQDRFKLVVHTEPQTQPVFDLELARPGQTGPQLRAHQVDEQCVGPIEPQFTTLAPSRAGVRPPSIFQLPSLPCGAKGFVTIGGGERLRFVGNDASMDRIAEAFRGPQTGIDRRVRDRTGLTGTYDLSLEWSVVSDTVQTPIASQDELPPRFLEALKTQLGLTLKSARGPVDVLVVDRVERPREN